MRSGGFGGGNRMNPYGGGSGGNSGGGYGKNVETKSAILEI